MFLSSRDKEDIAGLDGQLLALNHFDSLSANRNDDRLAAIVVMIGDLTPGNKEAEHPSQALCLMLLSEDLRPVGLPWGRVCHLHIFFRFENFHDKLLSRREVI